MFALVLFGLGRHVRTNWDQLPDLSMPHPGWLLLAWSLGLGAMLIVPVILSTILGCHGCRVSVKDSVGLFYVPLQGKYIPGKVWSMVWAMSAYRRVGADWPTALSCLIVLTLLNLVSAMVVALGLGNSLFEFPWYVGLFAFTMLLAIEPRLFRRGVNFALKRVGRDPVHNVLAGPQLVRLCLLNICYWLVFGLSYWALAYSMFPALEPRIDHLIAAQAGAFLIALLAFFAPAGLGVREGILAGILAPVVGIGPALALALSQRLWQISLEVPWAIAGLFFLRKLNPERSLPETV